MASVSPVIQRAWLLLGYGVEPVHPGAGRSPGVVDLPVVRDEAGYPYVPRSEVRGALKHHCMAASGCLEKCMEKVDDRRMKCFRDGRVVCQ